MNKALETRGTIAKGLAVVSLVLEGEETEWD